MIENLTDQQILSVSDLNRQVKKLLENHFQLVWIEGEISNLSKPQSGHFYFSLKDEIAQVRCAMFRMRNLTLPFELENGMQILAAAKISLYEGRGDYQLIIEHIEERGEGLLRRRFEILKNKLTKEGFFNSDRKKKIPSFPNRIGVVTSPTGAAIRDVLSVLKRRFASIPIIIYPTAVQGEQAAAQIANTIGLANERNECDALILCRGGGSLEDLFAFNEEIVARAIFHSKIPIVAGIGHEIDFTIADFVSDQRAATPSAAAELLSPSKDEYSNQILVFYNRISQLISCELRHKKILISSLQKRVSHPNYLLQHYSQTIDIKEQAIIKAVAQKIEQEKQKVQFYMFQLTQKSPKQTLKENKLQLDLKLQLFFHLMSRKLQDTKQNLVAISKTLNTVSPLNTLERGYSITTRNSHIVEDVSQIERGENIRVELKTGFLVCIVDEIEQK